MSKIICIDTWRTTPLKYSYLILIKGGFITFYWGAKFDLSSPLVALCPKGFRGDILGRAMDEDLCFKTK